MKKILYILLAVMMLAALCACSSEPAEEVTFRNDTDTAIDGFYISSVSNDEWGDSLNFSKVSPGGTIHLDADCLTDGPGAAYDIGAIDETGFGYDIYEVTLNIGDTIALARDGDAAILTVTGGDGSSTEYTGYAYQESEVAG